MTKMPRILIVDDEPDICEILRFNLEMEGYHVLCAENPIEAEPMLIVHGNHNETVDLILLDVMMTPKSGFEWAKELKADAQTAHIPIIFCTAYLFLLHRQHPRPHCGIDVFSSSLRT